MIVATANSLADLGSDVAPTDWNRSLSSPESSKRHHWIRLQPWVCLVVVHSHCDETSANPFTQCEHQALTSGQPSVAFSRHLWGLYGSLRVHGAVASSPTASAGGPAAIGHSSDNADART